MGPSRDMSQQPDLVGTSMIVRQSLYAHRKMPPVLVRRRQAAGQSFQRNTQKMPTPKSGRLSLDSNVYSPETLAENLQRAAVEMERRRPVGDAGIWPDGDSAAVALSIEQRPIRFIARLSRRSWTRELKHKRPDDISDQQDPIGLEATSSGEFVYKSTYFVSSSRPASGCSGKH